jgi:cysteine dioxygenase
MIQEPYLSEMLRAKNDPNALRLLLDRSGFSIDSLEKMKPLPQSDFPYSRKMLHNDGHIEIMLANWTPKKTCSPHDHGASQGWVFYLKGNFREQKYVWSDGILSLDETQDHLEGSHIHVNNDGIHSCMSYTEGLSLHIYFPRIESMRVYDLKNQRTLLVNDDCGAWIPSPMEIKKEIKWKK